MPDRQKRSIVMRSRLRPVTVVALAAAALLAVRFSLARSAIASLPPVGVPVRVVRAVDGDTLLLETGHRVRLIGVNTPETKHPKKPAEPWGEEASAFTHSLVDGRNVTLEFDRERRDDYGRVLAYATIDGRLVNEAIIAAGFSRAENRFPFRSDRKTLFLAAEKQARERGIGIWSGNAVKSVPMVDDGVESP